MQRSSINIMKCRGMRNQRIACKELGRNVDKEIKNDKEQIKTVQCTKISIQITRILGGWITAHFSYLDGGRSLTFGTILAFKS